MYNEDQKLEYISFEATNSRTLTRYFNRIAPREEFYDKDIADMSEEELKESLLSLNIRSITSKGHLISLIRAYINWCIENKKTENKNVAYNIKPEDIDSKHAIKIQMLRSPEQIRYILNTVYNPDIYKYTNRAIQNKLVFWLIYCGLRITELSSLKKTDINYDKKIVINPVNRNAHYDINDEVVFLWERQTKQTYIEKGGVHNKNDVYYYELIENDFLFRPIKGNNTDTERKYSVSLLASIIIVIFRDYYEQTSEKLRISPENIRLSGAFYKLYLREINGEQITPDMMIVVLGLTPSSDSDLRLLTRKYFIDYEEWKSAFNYS